MEDPRSEPQASNDERTFASMYTFPLCTTVGLRVVGWTGVGQRSAREEVEASRRKEELQAEVETKSYPALTPSEYPNRRPSTSTLFTLDKIACGFEWCESRRSKCDRDWSLDGGRCGCRAWSCRNCPNEVNGRLSYRILRAWTAFWSAQQQQHQQDESVRDKSKRCF